MGNRKIMSMQDVINSWQDSPEVHQAINEDFAEKVNATPELKLHRDWTEQNIFGFGERSFLWLHKLLVDEMPGEFSFCEIGVFRGAILSLYKLLADVQGKKVMRYGVSPMSNAGGHWDSDYEADVKTIHNQFKLKKDYTIIKGLSTDAEIIKQTQAVAPFDILYIDGGHDYETVVSDLKHYLPMVKPGGYLVVDDCCNEMNMPFGYFTGIEPVTKAVREVLPNNEFEFLFSLVHNKVFRKS